jgi:hypothetical protein
MPSSELRGSARTELITNAVWGVDDPKTILPKIESVVAPAADS